MPPEIYPGLMIEYSVSPLFGIPLTWMTEITHVDAPDYFADEQRVGPYRLWHHEHFFRAIGSGTTEVRDLVTYAPPLGLLGAILNAWMIRPQLERIFAYRARSVSPREDWKAQLDPLIKTFYLTFLTISERKRLWNSKTSKPSLT